MRTLKILFVLVAVVLSGFSRDSQTVRTGKWIVVPLKFSGVVLPDDGRERIPCLPVEYGIAHSRFGFLQGHQTHGGELITEQSTWEIISCSTDLATGINTSQCVGVNTVSNRDTYNYYATMLINIVTQDVTMNVTVSGGTGRFEGVTGEATFSGKFVGHTIPCTGEGFMSFPK